MKVNNPLVPPPFAVSGSGPAQVANAPRIAPSATPETSQPVQANERSEGSRPDSDRRGEQIDFTV